MSVSLAPDVLEDELAVTLARVMAAANKRAGELGVDTGHSLITIAQRPLDGELVWRVNYGPREYVGRRGGDIIIDVDPRSLIVKQVLRGQ